MPRTTSRATRNWTRAYESWPPVRQTEEDRATCRGRDLLRQFAAVGHRGCGALGRRARAPDRHFLPVLSGPILGRPDNVSSAQRYARGARRPVSLSDANERRNRRRDRERNLALIGIFVFAWRAPFSHPRRQRSITIRVRSAPGSKLLER